MHYCSRIAIGQWDRGIKTPGTIALLLNVDDDHAQLILPIFLVLTFFMARK
jgi:hypothetical protein